MKYELMVTQVTSLKTELLRVSNTKESELILLEQEIIRLQSDLHNSKDVLLFNTYRINGIMTFVFLKKEKVVSEKYFNIQHSIDELDQLKLKYENVINEVTF